MVKLTWLAVKHSTADKNSAHSERFIVQQVLELELSLPAHGQQYRVNWGYRRGTAAAIIGVV